MSVSSTSQDRPNAYIGRRLPRQSAKRLLAGRGHFTDDIHLPRMVHIAFVRAPYAHAKIVSIDVTDASTAPGVHLVATGQTFAPFCEPWIGTLSHLSGMKSTPQLPLAMDKVVWSGQAVVAVLADTRAQAEDAAELVVVEYKELPTVANVDVARGPNSMLIDESLGDNLAFKTRLESGAVDVAFAEAALTVEAEFQFGRHTAVTLEPRTIVADYDPSENRLTVHQSTQTPFQMQDVYARHFGLPDARVRVISPDVGGSFGMKLHVYHEEMATVAASILLGRPVKFVADRLESFVTDIHARDHKVQARLAAAADGTLLGFEVDDVTAVGAFSAYPRTSAVEGNQVVRLIGGPYKHRNYRADLQVVFQNKTQASQYRAVGHPIACAVTERLIDMAAEKLNLDPFEVRRLNVITDEMYPYTSPTGYLFEQLSHRESLERLREFMDYELLRKEQSELRTRGVYRGIGIATFIEITNPGPAFYGIGGAHISAQDGAILKLTPAGEVQCLISVTEQGQGSETIIGQIVADQLGVDRETVRVITGDTEVTPYGGATWACRGAGIGGETALQAARSLRNNILQIAEALLQATPGDLDIQNGQIVAVRTGEARISLTDIARIAYFRSDSLPQGVSANLTVAHHFAPKGYPFAFTNGVQGSYVEVDVETGIVKILGHWVVEDCGRMINPLLVEEQVRGGVVQGLGAAFFEECLYSESGQLLNGSLADYLVPMACEMPDIKIAHLETPTKDTELGAKGCGEAGTAGASAAALNAVNDALRPFGITITQIPMTPTRILAALGRI